MVKKRGAIGIAVTVLVFSIILGIASLPDEVLEESSFGQPQTQIPVNQVGPSGSASIEKPMNSIPQSQETNPPVIAPIEIQTNSQTPSIQKSDLPEEETVSQSEQQNPPQKEEPENEDESKPNLIKIELSDGVGAGDR